MVDVLVDVDEEDDDEDEEVDGSLDEELEPAVFEVDAVLVGPVLACELPCIPCTSAPTAAPKITTMAIPTTAAARSARARRC